LLGLINIVILLVLIIANCLVFQKIDHLAGFFLIPYGLWVAFATAPNSAIWYLNSQGQDLSI
jgi:tryptophan-rich sensory protein